MPPKTRALFTSSTAWEKLGNDRRTPGSFSESTENGVLSPKYAAKIPAAAALTVECPEGCTLRQSRNCRTQLASLGTVRFIWLKWVLPMLRPARTQKL